MPNLEMSKQLEFFFLEITNTFIPISWILIILEQKNAIAEILAIMEKIPFKFFFNVLGH